MTMKPRRRRQKETPAAAAPIGDDRDENGVLRRLTNKHELYCQARAREQPHARALAYAGLKTGEHPTAHFDWLMYDPMITARINIIRAEANMLAPLPAVQEELPTTTDIRDIANEIGVTDRWIIEQLKAVVDAAIASGSPAPANRALATLADLTGIGDRKNPEPPKEQDDEAHLARFKSLLLAFEPDEDDAPKEVAYIPGINDRVSDD